MHFYFKAFLSKVRFQLTEHQRNWRMPTRGLKYALRKNSTAHLKLFGRPTRIRHTRELVFFLCKPTLLIYLGWVRQSALSNTLTRLDRSS